MLKGTESAPRNEGKTIRVTPMTSFWDRLRGLLGKPELLPNEGAWIRPCRQVHTLGMRLSLDILHLDENLRILHIETLKPWRVGRYLWGATSIVELRSGETQRLGLEVGMTVNLLVE